jgi:hypothetical protein
LEPKDIPPSEQPETGGVYLSGLKVNGGRLNDKTYFLEDEYSREFANSLPCVYAYVDKRAIKPEAFFNRNSIVNEKKII